MLGIGCPVLHLTQLTQYSEVAVGHNQPCHDLHGAGNEDDELESAASPPVPMARTASKPGSSPKAGAAPRPKPVKERKD